MKKRIIAVVLLAALVLSSSCSGEEGQVQSQNTSTVTLNNSVKSDCFTVSFNQNQSLNPLITQSSINLYLCGLMFDSLVTLDNSLAIRNNLAESVIMNEDNTLCTVKLKKGIKFSDGTEMSSIDIVATVNAVKANSASYYNSFFQNVTDVKSTEAYEAVFSLKQPDPFFEALLTFPIIKAGSTNETDFIGSGRYIPEFNEEIKLIKNENWYGGEISTNEIKLLSFENTDIIRHELDMGTVDFMYTEGSINTLGAVAMKTVTANNAVMLAYNKHTSVLKTAENRIAFDGILQRDILAGNEVSGIASNIPFHPSAYFTEGINTDVTSAISVKEIIEAEGYDLGEDGFYINEDGEKFTLKLIYLEADIIRNTQIERITEMYAQNGIALTVNAYVGEEEFSEAVEKNEYDLCYCEMSFLNNSDLSPLFNGMLANQLDNVSYDGFLKGEISLEDFLRIYLKEMPISVLYYRNGRALYSRSFDADIEIYPETLFGNAEKWILYK